MRLIDISKINAIDLWGEDGDCHVVYDYDEIHSASTVEAIPKADYEARLKADMVDMLEELKNEIIELPFPQREPEYMQGYSYCQMNILDYIIQQKIDKLKGDAE